MPRPVLPVMPQAAFVSLSSLLLAAESRNGQAVSGFAARRPTNHLLHFLITICTFGGWVFVWICVFHWTKTSGMRCQTLVAESSADP